MKYSIVIPTYNNCEKYLKPCIESIIKHTDLNDVELIISANGCTDNTEAYLNYLRTVVSNLKVVWDGFPLGYPKATNDGIKVTTGQYIVLLNNDTLLLDQNKNDWLDILNKPFLTNPKCGVSCIIKAFSPAAQHDFAIFFCVMIDRKVFDAIGLLNEEYGTGAGEDTEFCIEAERAGFEVCEAVEKRLGDGLYTGFFPMYHVGEGTMHNEALVQNWSEKFAANTARLEAKYGHKDIVEQLSWMADLNEEAREHYNEVVASNIYGVNRHNLKDRTVMDIGTNIGMFSIFASKLGAKKVVSVEPVSSTFATLTSNINRAGVTNIIANQNIASNETGGVVKMALQEKSGHNSAYMVGEHYEEIPTISFKDLLAQADDSNIFLKMDCEGGEYDILLNADFEDMKKVSTIAIEIHGDLHPVHKGIDLIRNRLTGFGFKPTKQTQIGCWDGVDANGKLINYRDLPITQEIWNR